MGDLFGIVTEAENRLSEKENSVPYLTSRKRKQAYGHMGTTSQMLSERA